LIDYYGAKQRHDTLVAHGWKQYKSKNRLDEFGHPQWYHPTSYHNQTFSYDAIPLPPPPAAMSSRRSQVMPRKQQRPKAARPPRQRAAKKQPKRPRRQARKAKRARGVTTLGAAISQGSRPPRYAYSRGHVQPFTDSINLPSVTANGITNLGGTVNLSPGFPLNVGICIAAISINPQLMSSISMLKSRSATYRKFLCSALYAEYDPSLLPGASTTPTSGQFYGFWDDNAELTSSYAIGSQYPIDYLRARKGGNFTPSILAKMRWNLPRGVGNQFKQYDVNPSIDPKTSTQAVFYLFQTMAPSTGPIVPCAQLTIGGVCNFMEDTFTPVAGATDLVFSSAASTFYSGGNSFGLPIASLPVATATPTITLPSIGSTLNVSSTYVGSLGVGMAVPSSGNSMMMAFPFVGNYVVVMGTSLSAGTTTGIAFGIAVSAANTTANAIDQTNLYSITATTTLGVASTIAQVFYVTVKVPGQYVTYTTLPGNPGTVTPVTVDILVTYVQTGLANPLFVNSPFQKTHASRAAPSLSDEYAAFCAFRRGLEPPLESKTQSDDHDLEEYHRPDFDVKSPPFVKIKSRVSSLKV
jgi:hypothetical protein